MLRAFKPSGAAAAKDLPAMRAAAVWPEDEPFFVASAELAL